MSTDSQPDARDGGAGLVMWLKVLVPAGFTLLVGVAGLYVDRSISNRAEKASSARLYTELLSRREEADSQLRKDMFQTVFAGFLAPPSAEEDGATGGAAGPDPNNTLSDGLLKLELLALNFGETLSLGPLFAEMNRRIHTDAWYSHPETLKIDRSIYRSRLERLARRVADRQLAALAPESAQGSFEIVVPLAKAQDGGVYSWPSGDGDGQREAKPASRHCMVLDDVRRLLTASFLGASTREDPLKRVDVELDVITATPTEDLSPSCREPWRECRPMPEECPALEIEPQNTIRFTLDHFNFPMIDNALLSNDHRLALVMHKFDFETGFIKMYGILFPGEFASRRDKPTPAMAIRKLQEAIPVPEAM